MEHGAAANGVAEHGVAAGLALAIEQSALGDFLRQSAWAYPTASVLHIWGLGLLLGAILAFDLRLLGVGRGVGLAAARGLLLPIARTGFALQLLSGVAMLVADASHTVANSLFQAKLVLILLALANVLLFHRVVAPDPSVPVASWPARAVAVVSLLAWFGVATLGRGIAYV